MAPVRPPPLLRVGDPTSTTDQIANTVILATATMGQLDLTDEELDLLCDDALSEGFDPKKVGGTWANR